MTRVYITPTSEQIKSLRLSKGLTQKRVASLLYCTERHYCRWETGANQMPVAYWELMNIKLSRIRRKK